MTAIQQRTATALPTPRTGVADDVPSPSDATARALEHPGPRPRPRHDYWDVATARWATGATTGTE